MAISDILQQWPTIVTGLGSLASGGLAVKWMEHLRAKRAQSDNVALSLVEDLRKELASVRAEQVSERDLCAARIGEANAKIDREAAHRHALESMVDSLMLAIELAPDKAAEAVAKVKERRDARRVA